MPNVKRRWSGSTSFGAVPNSVTVGIDDNWDLTKTFLVFSISTPTNANYYEAAVVSGKIVQGSGTKNLVFERASTGVYIVVSIEYTVIEMDEAIVVHGSSTFTNSQTVKTITITSVDLTKTFVITSGRIADNVSANPQHFLITAVLTNATTLTLTRGTALGALSIEYQIITISDIKSLQTKSGSITSSGSNITDVAITSIDLNKTITFSYFYTTCATFQSKHNREGHLTSDINLRLEAYTNIATNTLYYYVYIIEFASSNVYRGRTSMPSGNTVVTVNIGGTVDLTKTLAKLCGSYCCWTEANASAQDSGDSPFRTSMYLSTTVLNATRGKTGIAGYFAWEVIEFTKISVPVFRRRRFIAFTRK
jgi:hypothetical protein